jgi:hypothetical protein
MSSSVAGTTISAITEATGRGGTVAGRGGRGGRGRGATAVRGRGPQQPPRTAFKGDTEGMNANVFQCYEEQSDRRQFIKNKEALDSYVKKNLKYNEDLASLFAEEMTLPELDMQEELPEGSTPMEMRLSEGELQEFVKRRKCFRGNLAAVQAVILGQCSEASMKAKLRSHCKYKARHQCCFWLLQQIRAITLQFDKKGMLTSLSWR